jgi:hypothetical protein
MTKKEFNEAVLTLEKDTNAFLFKYEQIRIEEIGLKHRGDHLAKQAEINKFI